MSVMTICVLILICISPRMDNPSVLAALFWAAVVTYGIVRLLLAAMREMDERRDTPLDNLNYR